MPGSVRNGHALAGDGRVLTTTEQPGTEASGGQPDTERRADVGHGLAFLGEALVATSMSLLLVQLSRSVDVNPLDRIGQVSGLAALDLRFLVLGLVVLAAVIVTAAVRAPRVFPLTCRLACAGVAGLATGLMGGGLVLALRGTTWPLFADLGDAGQLTGWADSLVAGGSMPAAYPPLAVHLLAWWAELTTSSTADALQIMQIVGTALFGPVAYLAWRLLLPPGWALGIGLVAALPLIEPYKPYSNAVLIALLPVTIKFLQLLSRSGTASWRRLALSGLGAGAATGLLFLTYSGWFVWSAMGVCAALLIVFPWRTGFVRGLVLLGVTSTVFLGIAAPHLLGILRAAGGAKDTYFYFDTYVEPAYIAMWRSDLPGNPGPWPPPGELASVGLFTVLLVVGLGVAIALAGQHTVVITLGCCLISSWLMRFWLAGQMYETQSVQLYPRTTAEILYCLLLLCGFAAYFASQRFGRPRIGLSARSPAIGALSAVLLLSLFAGSAISDHYLPRPDNSQGILAYFAQMVKQQNGNCPAYSWPDKCAASSRELQERLANGR